MEFIVFGEYGDDIPTWVWLGMLAVCLLGCFKGLMEQSEEGKVLKEFLLECAVADEIASIKYRSSTCRIVLAKRTDGKWGIASKYEWLHVGQGQYIAGKWKEKTGQYPYIQH